MCFIPIYCVRLGKASKFMTNVILQNKKEERKEKKEKKSGVRKRRVS